MSFEHPSLKRVALMCLSQQVLSAIVDTIPRWWGRGEALSC